MRISATGRSKSSRRAASGFTLLEILVVVLIIGIMAAGITLSLGSGRDSDRGLDAERDRVLTIIGHLREQAGLQNREFGMRCFDGGYEFMVRDARRGLWEVPAGDALTRRRRLPPGIDLALSVEGRQIVLPRPDAKDPAPQVMLFSSGEVSVFELTLRREDSGGERGAAVRILPDPDAVDGPLLAEPLAAT